MALKSPICELLGIEFPLVAFTHCRDVVVEVSKAGGFGVLGAAGYNAETLEIAGNVVERAWHAGINVRGAKISGNVRDCPLVRILIHQNKVTDAIRKRLGDGAITRARLVKRRGDEDDEPEEASSLPSVD